jgi:RNA polymerase sporulation-specific sigma factor
VACGQSPGIEDAYLRWIASEVNDLETYHGVPWRDFWREVRAFNSHQHNITPFILADRKRRQEEKEARAKPPPLTAAQARMVTTHLKLARNYAGKYAFGDQGLFAALDDLGVRTLMEQARKYDPHRGVTFGAYAQHRVRGAMLDYLKLNHGREIAVGGPDEVMWAKRPANDRLTVDYEEPRERDARNEKRRANRRGRAPVRKPIGAIAEIERVLPKLNRKQQAVYRGRVLTEPPLSRADLAHQLGITDLTQISRIERQAQRKVAELLAKTK